MTHTSQIIVDVAWTGSTTSLACISQLITEVAYTNPGIGTPPSSNALVSQIIVEVAYIKPFGVSHVSQIVVEVAYSSTDSISGGSTGGLIIYPGMSGDISG
jgi:hypothetical protein